MTARSFLMGKVDGIPAFAPVMSTTHRAFDPLSEGSGQGPEPDRRRCRPTDGSLRLTEGRRLEMAL